MVTDYLSEKECCGCMLCEKECPVDAISQRNTAGFLYPVVDMNKCIGCKQCIHVCPILNANELKRQRETNEIILASNKSKDEKQRSTSGGVFIELAAAVIHGGGVLYMARNIRETGKLFMRELQMKVV